MNWLRGFTVLDEEFENRDEKLCRAIFFPPGINVKNNGEFSSAVFKDKNNAGLSVDRAGCRNERQIINCFIGRKSRSDYVAFAIITVYMCNFPNRADLPPAKLLYKPLEGNDYHSEIYKTYDMVKNCGRPLTNGQAKYLATDAKFIRIENVSK